MKIISIKSRKDHKTDYTVGWGNVSSISEQVKAIKYDESHIVIEYVVIYIVLYKDEERSVTIHADSDLVIKYAKK